MTPVSFDLQIQTTKSIAVAVNELEIFRSQQFGGTIEGEQCLIMASGIRNVLADGGQRGWRHIAGINIVAKRDLKIIGDKRGWRFIGGQMNEGRVYTL